MSERSGLDALLNTHTPDNHGSLPDRDADPAASADPGQPADQAQPADQPHGTNRDVAALDGREDTDDGRDGHSGHGNEHDSRHAHGGQQEAASSRDGRHHGSGRSASHHSSGSHGSSSASHGSAGTHTPGSALAGPGHGGPGSGLASTGPEDRGASGRGAPVQNTHAPVATPLGGTHTWTDDLTANLGRLQQQASALRDILNRAISESPDPAETTGSDRSGTVIMVVGADGFPQSVRVARDWERKIRPEQFAVAIVEASQAARSERLTLAADALQSGRGTEQAVGMRADRETQDRIPTATGQGPREVEPQSLDSLVEHALKLFSDVEQFRPPPPVQGTGRAAGGRLSVTLFASGAVSCSADPQWVAGKTSAMLASTFREAVEDARSALAEAQPPGATPATSPSDALKALFDEAMALLQDPRRLTE